MWGKEDLNQDLGDLRLAWSARWWRGWVFGRCEATIVNDRTAGGIWEESQCGMAVSSSGLDIVCCMVMNFSECGTSDTSGFSGR